MKERDTLIDMAKGIGIILVVFGHIHKGQLSQFIYLFHMPLFFILAGCSMTYSRSANQVKWKSLARSLAVPYLVYSIIFYLYWAFFESKFRPIHDGSVLPFTTGLGFKTDQFVNIFTAFDCPDSFIYDIVLWFLPCLFSAKVIYGYVNQSLRPLLYSLLLASIGYIAIKMCNISCLWCMELALITLPLLYLGHHFYQDYKHRCASIFNKTLTISIVGGGGILLIFNQLDTHIEMHSKSIPLILYVTALAGFTFVGGISLLLEKTRFKSTILFLGKNSLFIMCVHDPIKRIVIKAMSAFTAMETDAIRQNIPLSLILLCILLVIIWPLIIIVNKWGYWTLGKVKKGLNNS